MAPLSSLPDELFESEDERVQEVIGAIDGVKAAIESLPKPKDVVIPKPNDYTAQFRAVTEKLDRLLNLIANAPKPDRYDDAAVVKALETVAKGQKDIVRALNSPRELVFDEAGEPVGTRPMN